MAGPSPNPFALTDRRGQRGKGPDRPHMGQVISEAERAERLRGYIRVPPEAWPNIKYSTHVRYIGKDGGFRLGGFIMKNPLDTLPGGATGGPQEAKRFMKLRNGFTKQAMTWMAAYNDLAEVYMKPDAGVLSVMADTRDAIESLDRNMKRLAEYARGLEARLAALEGKK